ncbi:hypothetical protein Sjap_024428 [Stephania japonica]|uniref:Ubiquitin receptor RAD23 n=1 Tax=Stephania japonica TaxID=461633 RepID=A0AAP0EDC4_9MAGN
MAHAEKGSSSQSMNDGSFAGAAAAAAAMKVFVKTLKGTHFEIEVEPQHTVSDVKKNIETVQGSAVYPAAQQMLIHQGKVLKDNTTLDENKVAENSFLVIMLTKIERDEGRKHGFERTLMFDAPTATPQAPAAPIASTPAVPEPAPAASPAPAPAPASTGAAGYALASDNFPDALCCRSTEDVYSRAASNLVAGNNFEDAIQMILDMGGGTWDRDTVVRALRAAYNNPERAVEYLYTGVPAMGSNAGAGTLDFLRTSQQFQALRAMVQANPQILQLEEMGFDRATVLQVFFACNKNEELAANYLLDHMHEFQD